MQDSIFVLNAVSDMINNRITILSDAALQVDDTILQIRLLTLAIVVGTVLLTPEIKEGWKWKLGATGVLFIILLMPFMYDLFSIDQQSRGREKVHALEELLPTISDSSYAWLKSFTFDYQDSLHEAEWDDRWEHRLKEEWNGWQVGWYIMCFAIGIFLLIFRSNFYKIPPLKIR